MNWEEALGNLSKGQKELLGSNTSMTLDLESLLGSTLAVEVRLRGETTIEREAAEYLGEPAGAPGFEREVWLTAEGKRVLYARTLIPLGSIDDNLLGVLEEEHAEPLGRVLKKRNVPFSKKRLEFGVVRCPRLAADLEIDAETPLVARRYILFSTQADNELFIKAAVTEIFSPEIISGPPLKAGNPWA
jgi:chorismate-pyruvate lyase